MTLGAAVLEGDVQGGGNQEPEVSSATSDLLPLAGRQAIGESISLKPRELKSGELNEVGGVEGRGRTKSKYPMGRLFNL